VAISAALPREATGPL